MLKSIIKKLITTTLVVSFTLFPASTCAASANKSNIQNTITTNLINTKNNNYPIVLVHGLSGWGGNEVLNLYYWGGKSSLVDMLNKEGHEVYAPSLGPFSSNWDRACELYAYLKGGTVDYGKAHSQKFGHAQYGRTYPGVLQDLGTYDENNIMKKVHLVGHSMGGQTIRVLAQLLEEGSQEEIDISGDSVSDLFTGNKHYIETITTISTPHDGSQFAEKLENDIQPMETSAIAAIGAITGDPKLNKLNLDFKFDQWGLRKQNNESSKEYISRILKSNIWHRTKDISSWDLTLEGAKELNTFAKTKDDIYYFSIACCDTHKSLLNNHQIPNTNMNPLLINSSFLLGRYCQNDCGKVIVDESWWKNDGVVSVRSAMGPHEGCDDQIVDYDGTPKKGVWNYMGEIDNVDHLQITMQQNPSSRESINDKYRSLAQMLESL